MMRHSLEVQFIIRIQLWINQGSRWSPRSGNSVQYVRINLSYRPTELSCSLTAASFESFQRALGMDMIYPTAKHSVHTCWVMSKHVDCGGAWYSSHQHLGSRSRSLRAPGCHSLSHQYTHARHGSAGSSEELRIWVFPSSCRASWMVSTISTESESGELPPRSL